MDSPTLWWILAGVLVAAELASGTFYLLMLSLGAAAAALVAHAGAEPTWHWVAFAVVGGGAVIVLHLVRKRGRQSAADARNDHLDLGATVEVTQWSAEGDTRVHYRGTDWPARSAHAGTLHLGPHRITGQDGNVLLLVPLPSAKPQPPTASGN